jgi:carbamoylphosphate synthase large subunit
MNSSTVLLLVVIGTLIILLALLILFHHNLNATKGYKLRSLEHARAELLLDQEVLNMRIAKSQALDSLRNDPQIQAMVKPKNAKFVQIEESVVEQVARE